MLSSTGRAAGDSEIDDSISFFSVIVARFLLTVATDAVLVDVADRHPLSASSLASHSTFHKSGPERLCALFHITARVFARPRSQLRQRRSFKPATVPG